MQCDVACFMWNNIVHSALAPYRPSMQPFNLTDRLIPIYDSYPEAQDRPLIGITCNIEGEDYNIRQRYCDQIERAGGTPVLLPPVTDVTTIIPLVDRLHAILFTGGADHNPLWMGEEPCPQLGSINPRRDSAELMLCHLAYNRHLPMLGICRGMQTIAIALGGHVRQHIQTAIKHSQNAPKDEPTHTVTITSGTLLAEAYAAGIDQKIMVNSFHHQAVDATGDILRVSATAPDGTIEGIESANHRQIIGVQWHPEQMGEDGQPVFRWIVGAARIHRDALRFHERNLTLDSHCDTPMFFADGIDFLKRDSRLCYDLHKMDEGHIDAVSMVCYLPQPKIGERFSDKVGFDVDGPSGYADLIFDKINDICQRAPQRLSIARTPADVWRDKREGRHSILLGIENGIAIEHDLRLLKHFKQRGITYMTLCHNGDNDICDSARGCNTHNGLSRFGYDVIRTMNELGILVDLSHAAETSFYQAIEASATPIVCSHSCCRALCDHPRNLTDDQMRALAASGGIMQLTMYEGFVKKAGTAVTADGARPDTSGKPADINDFICHLRHAIDIMGIDHVGIGTDFDGDGGISGLKDASELINLTETLMRQGFSRQDITKLWGHNWLRLMARVQGMATVMV